MNQFTTRVELHSATVLDYSRLHAEMERRNFHRIIKDDSGISYHLPTAEYNSFGEITSQQVLALAQEAVTAVGKTAYILVTQAVMRLFVLQPAR